MIEGEPVREFCTSLVKQQTKSHEKQKAQPRVKRDDAATIALGRKFAYAAYRPPPTNTVEESFRHSGWRVDRRRVELALAAANVPANRRERFEGCGGDCHVEWSVSRKRHRLKANYCGDRFCVPCCSARSARARRHLAGLCKGECPLFMTFTLQASDLPLSALITQLIESFSALRRHRLWSDAIRAGAYVIEVKKGKNSGRWHPHLHVLALGSFIAQRQLSDAWRAVSGGSYVVDIQRVRQSEEAVGYVGKYVAKGWSREVVQDHDSLVECMLAMRGRRLLGTFGSWRGMDPDGDDGGERDWVSLGRIAYIWGEAKRGVVWARGVMSSLRYGEESLAENPAPD